MFKGYKAACEYLGHKDVRPYRTDSRFPRSTTVERLDDGQIGVRYHDTLVVIYTREGVILNTGGFRTLTTKARINMALDDLQVPWRVWQTAGVWYLHNWRTGADPIPFVDGLEIAYDGALLNLDEDAARAEVERIKTLTKQINKYVAQVRALIKDEKLPVPGPGDCLLCWAQMTGQGKFYSIRAGGVEQVQKPSNDHLLNHLRETYIHGSLIVLAVNEYSSQATKWGLQALWDGDIREVKRWDGTVSRMVGICSIEHLADDVAGSVRRYFKLALGVGR